MTGPDPLAAAMLAHRDILLPVADLAALRAAPLQWEAPRGRAPEQNDIGPYRSADHADPTALTVMDSRRLRLRAAYLATVDVIEKSNADLREVEAELRAALAPYGEANDDFPECPADRPGVLPYAA